VKAEVLTIGDELLRGEIVDTNKSHLSQRLLELDIETRFHVTVADDPSDMREVFLRAAVRSDVILVSGGLGPTRDDLTIEVLAETFGRKLVLDEASLATIRAFFARFGREMAEINAKQAYFPEGAEVLPNPVGTAPGTMLEVPKPRGADIAGGGALPTSLFFCMPGVPRELYKMMEEQVMPRIAPRRQQQSVSRAALLRTFGIGESNLDELLRGVDLEPGVELGFRTAFPDNYVRPVARGADAAAADALLERSCRALRERLGPLCYGEGDAETLEAVTGALLRERKVRIAVAESCTGGLIGQRFTAIAGSSDYFLGGVIAYSNEAKQALLGVPAELLAEHGAVSEPVALAMAEGVRDRFGADLTVATTGISGPGGGTADKPVGLVFVALAHAGGSQAHRLLFPLDRERHRQITAQLAIDWMRRHLLGEVFELPRIGRKLS